MKNQIPSLNGMVVCLGILALSSTVPPGVSGQDTSPTSAVALDKLKAAVSGLADRPAMASASLGVAVLRLGTDPEWIHEVGAARSLIPASTVKLLTSATALHQLGPEMVFETVLGHRGSLGEDGVLSGDLIIRGGGDPTLAEDGWGTLFERWLQAVRRAGIRRVEGGVVGDASYYAGPPRPGGWQWRDLGNYYASGAEGLNFHGNAYQVRFRPGKPGDPAQFLGTHPSLPSVTFHNEMRTGPAGSGDQGYVYAAPYGQVIFLRGKVPAGGVFTIKGALPEPALTCAQLFKTHLEKHGIEVHREGRSARMAAAAEAAAANASEPWQEIHKQVSPPLADLLVRMNHKSVNLFAETVIRRLGKIGAGSGSTDAGVDAVKAYFAELGIPLPGLVLEDGSGLSRANLITPRQMVLFLAGADAGAHGEAFRRSLPLAGRSGTLSGVGRGTSAEGRIQAKSGTLDGVKCYAGYARARSGGRLAFALMVNHYTGSYAEVKPGIIAILARIAEL